MKNKRLEKVILYGCCLLISIHTFAQSSNSSQKKPNIIFLLTDDLGWKDLSAYGSTFDETPNLDRLAKEGMLFTDAYASCNVCSPSRSSIMTGQYPVHTGITDWITGRQTSTGPMPYDKLLPPSFSFNLDTTQVTIAEALKKGGYATFFAGKWHLGLTPQYWPENQGFDINKGGWAAGNPWAHGMGGYFSPYRNPRLTDGPKGEFLTDRLTTETIKFIKKKANEGKPFFADLSFYAVHERIQAKPEYIKKFKEKAHRMGLDTLLQFIKDAPWMQEEAGWKERVVQSNAVYAALLYSVDENVGRIMKVLKQLGIADNTIVVFTSDNGGLSTSEGTPTSNLPLRYGKGWNYEGGIRVPLIIKWPGVTKPNAVCRFPVINTDFYPTFLQMAHLPLMPRQHKDGVSMVPLLEGHASINQPLLYWHYPHYSNQGGGPSSAVREGNWKLIQFYTDNHVELYNLRADIEERRDLAKIFPDKAAVLLKQLNLWKKATHAKLPTLNPYYNDDYKFLMQNKRETKKEFLSDYHKLFGRVFKRDAKK
jgi:arylsulfatase A-like enzyme